ncbi:MAG: GNAT family N-acetyltransferase [Actinomycetota bacterium]
MTVARFLEGLVAEAQIDAEMLTRVGTTVVGREDRAGSGVVVCYWAGEHTLVWADPEVIDRIGSMNDGSTARPLAEVTDTLTAGGFDLLATADMRVLSGPPVQPARIPKGYNHRWLTTADADVALVKAFADRSDPVDVEEAALDDLDNFDETAINVLTAADDPLGETLLAYGSACDWDWDPLFGDIGVLVDPEHRKAGLGRLVVAHTTQQLVTEGRIPLYRHGRHNLGSMGIAVGLGFEVATTLAYFTSPTSGD